MIFIFFILLLVIFYQDLKERQVFLITLLLSMVLGGCLFFKSTLLELFIYKILVNFLLISTLISLIYLYSKHKLNKSFFESFGLGDLLLFITLGVSLPTISFLVVFSLSLIFSFIMFSILKSKMTHKTVPLASFQALFFYLIT